MRQRALASVLLASTLVLAACGDDDDESSSPATSSAASPATEPVASTAPGAAFPEERCEANRAAGTVTFLTGFDYAAAASIVEVIVADAAGYYEALCLDVDVVSSFSTANYPIVASGDAQFASGGSFSEVINFAQANDAPLVAVMVDGRTPIDTLILQPGTAASLEDLAGTTIGVKGKLPAGVEVMLRGAGLTEGEDYQTVLIDGFDPLQHIAIPDIVGFPGWKSNEPGQLQRAGVAFDQFDPTASDVPGSFGAIFTTRSFLDEHPTAAQDFVRATLKGLADAIADPAAASAAAVALVTANGNPNFLSPEGEAFRWETEADLIASLTPAGVAPGTPDLDTLGGEVATYAEVGFFGEGVTPDASQYADPSLAQAVVDSSGTVVWPS
jgi:ABC-type nitrate/sulfonate/bicarbonate transport system substrate-binding protein